MKSVLISIKPKWCELIESGKKTIEVRRTRPNIETPFKCYIYCTKARTDMPAFVDEDGHVIYTVGGNVIGEFVCDEIEHFTKAFFDEQDERDTEEIAYFLEESCLSYSELCNYVKLDDFYGWHISDLKIYEKPRELSEFWAYNEELHKRYDSEEDFCCYDDTNEYGEALTDCGDAYNNILNCYRCWEEWSGWCHHVTHPPQSWCYVEELPWEK